MGVSVPAAGCEHIWWTDLCVTVVSLLGLLHFCGLGDRDRDRHRERNRDCIVDVCARTRRRGKDKQRLEWEKGDESAERGERERTGVAGEWTASGTSSHANAVMRGPARWKHANDAVMTRKESAITPT